MGYKFKNDNYVILETKGLKDLPIGTLVVWKDGKCVPCNKYADELVMGVAGDAAPVVAGRIPQVVDCRLQPQVADPWPDVDREVDRDVPALVGEQVVV